MIKENAIAKRVIVVVTVVVLVRVKCVMGVARKCVIAE
jgi:hypothetical protein